MQVLASFIWISAISRQLRFLTRFFLMLIGLP